VVGAVGRELDSLLDLAASEATGADPDALCRSVDQGADPLKVGIKGPFRLIICVADVMA
jgi:hypothetical protein